tara:strand:- start:4717 stop:6447 length:1731 start_codon:yes stop_codon:yes gene_type:complete
MVKKNIIKLDTDFTKNVSISTNITNNPQNLDLICSGGIGIAKNIVVGNNLNVSDRAIMNNITVTNIHQLPITNSSNLVSLAITNNKLQINTLPNIETGITIYGNVPAMLSSMATKGIGKQAITSDTGSLWMKVGTTLNPYYHLVSSANLTQAAQTFSSAKYEITTSTTKPTTYTQTITTSGTTNINLLETNKKYVHFEIKVTDELQPIIQAPFGTVTNITTSSPTIVTSSSTHTWTNYIEYTGTIPITVASPYIIKSTDQGLNRSPPTTNVYKFINLSLQSIPPNTYITHQGYNGDGNMATYFNKTGPWTVQGKDNYGNSKTYSHYFWKPKLYQKFKIGSRALNPPVWITIQELRKQNNNLLYDTNTALYTAQWPQYGKDIWNYYISGHNGNTIADATTFIALHYNNDPNNEINLYPMIDPNYTGGNANQYNNNIYTATTSQYKAGLVSEEISSQKTDIGIYIRKGSSNVSDDGNTYTYDSASLNYFNLFMNYPGKSVTNYNWKTNESNQTSYANDPKIITADWAGGTGNNHFYGFFSNQENTGIKLTYCDFIYCPPSEHVGHKWGSRNFRLYAVG